MLGCWKVLKRDRRGPLRSRVGVGVSILGEKLGPFIGETSRVGTSAEVVCRVKNDCAWEMGVWYPAGVKTFALSWSGKAYDEISPPELTGTQGPRDTIMPT
jgi:hypothetical protein